MVHVYNHCCFCRVQQHTNWFYGMWYSVCLSFCLWICLSICVSICVSVCFPLYPSVCICLFVCLSVYLYVCLSVSRSVCLFAVLLSYHKRVSHHSHSLNYSRGSSVVARPWHAGYASKALLSFQLEAGGPVGDCGCVDELQLHPTHKADVEGH